MLPAINLFPLFCFSTPSSLTSEYGSVLHCWRKEKCKRFWHKLTLKNFSEIFLVHRAVFTFFALSYSAAPHRMAIFFRSGVSLSKTFSNFLLFLAPYAQYIVGICVDGIAMPHRQSPPIHSRCMPDKM